MEKVKNMFSKVIKRKSVVIPNAISNPDILNLDCTHIKKENTVLKSHISSLTDEIENIYKTTKEHFKGLTNDFEAFKSAFGRWTDKIKEKLPGSQIRHVHDRSEAKENKFSLERVAELDKLAKQQKSAKKRNMDLER